MSFMYNKKSRGPKMDPYGTPHLTDKRSDECLLQWRIYGGGGLGGLNPPPLGCK